MRTTLLAAILAIVPWLLCGAASASQEPPPSKPQQPPQQQEQQKPAPPPASLSPMIPVAPAAGTGEQQSKPEEPGDTPDPAKIAAPAHGASVHGAKAPVDDKTYRIGAEDVVGVGVWGDPRLSGQFVVRPDGKISMPLIGDVQAAGKTPGELQETIGAALQEKYIKSPDVNVQILQVHSKKYFIEGEVNKPGPYDLIVPTTVLEGLSNAGGFRDFANTKKIRVLRGTKVLFFNYKEVTNGKKLEQNVYLEPGDHIIVK